MYTEKNTHFLTYYHFIKDINKLLNEKGGIINTAFTEILKREHAPFFTRFYFSTKLRPLISPPDFLKTL